MVRRWSAAAGALLLVAAGCSGGSGDEAGDPLAEAPLTTVAGHPPAAGGYQPATRLGQLADPAIKESSGLAASRRNPGMLWTHNDSDDGPLVYCLDLQGGSCGTWRVTGAEAFDWEDMAAGPGPRSGEPYLYLGDIGDNLDQRTEIVVYRVPEPVAPAGAASLGGPAATAPAEALRLRYPDGPHNAEALLVHPTTGDLYVVTKDAQAAGVYKAAAPLDPARPASLVRLGAIRLGSGSRGLEQVTGGDISPDGRRVAVCTYAQGYELELPQGAVFDDIWGLAPVRVDVGARLQGESIAYRLDGKALLTTSEIAPSPLLQAERR